jgi:hypothetical protein
MSLVPGTFFVRVLEITAGTERVQFRPKGIMVVGAAGRKVRVALSMLSSTHSGLGKMASSKYLRTSIRMLC